MPTAESAAFLAKKPTVPPTFDGVDYDDTKRLKQAQDAIVREQWVQVMMGRLVREELSKCYYREGVNHLEKCGQLRGQLYTSYKPASGLCLDDGGEISPCDHNCVILTRNHGSWHANKAYRAICGATEDG
jgi:hypothetical protein